ncbi:MAG: hypothetical protein JW819_02660 [Candidatus Krumholzibacteriota bacterium]|nr:hypothetical protein [Candidatus Krumholzibacteriota bacterium]
MKPGNARRAALAVLFCLSLASVIPAAAQDLPAAPPAPPLDLTAEDTPNDRGHAIALSWVLSPDDDGSGRVTGYSVWRAVYRPGVAPADLDWTRVGSHSAGYLGDERLTHSDVSDDIVNNLPYLYRVEADGPGGASAVLLPASIMARAQWFNRARWNMLLAVLVLSAGIMYWIQKAQTSDIYLRPVAGLKAFDEAIGRATEMGNPVLFVPGIMDMDQIETLAGVSILGYVGKMTARYETPLEVPVSRSLVMAHAREVVKESYLQAGRPDLYNDDMIHYLTDDQFGYAAAVDGIMLRQKPAACFYQGKFYAESLILAETGNSIGAIQIAGTASPAQLPFFITACDYTLIGEEFFAASAYLSQEKRAIGSIRGQDVGKLIFMVALILGVFLVSLEAVGVRLPGWLDITALFDVSSGG